MERKSKTTKKTKQKKLFCENVCFRFEKLVDLPNVLRKDRKTISIRQTDTCKKWRINEQKVQRRPDGKTVPFGYRKTPRGPGNFENAVN